MESRQAFAESTRATARFQKLCVLVMIFLSATLHIAFSIYKYNIQSIGMHVCDEFFIFKSYAAFALSAGTFATRKLSANNFPRFLRINESYFHNYNPCTL